MSALEDEKSYTLWIGRKATTLRQEYLDCGHLNKGEVFYHAWCDRLSCSKACAKAEHECGDYAGVKSSTEKVSEPPLSVAELRYVNPVEPGHLVVALDTSSGTFERFERVAVEDGVSAPTSPWVSFADVAAGPAAGVDAAVDVRRRVQDGTAPAPDPIGDAFLAVLSHQELRPPTCTCPLVDVSTMAERARGIASSVQGYDPRCPACPDPFADHRERPDQPEPVSPLVDEPLEPDPDVHHRPFRFTDLYAALRARARHRGGR